MPVGDVAPFWNGDTWRGWCSEKGVELATDTWYTVTLLSSQAASLPDRIRNGEYGLRRWDCVNWLLNNRPAAAGYYQMESALYHLLGEMANPPVPGTLIAQMVNDAVTYGTGFRAQAGDWVAVIMLTPTDVQLCFIEVDP